MIVINRHNRKVYRVLKADDKNVTLERDDGTEFTISKSDFNFFYAVQKGE